MSFEPNSAPTQPDLDREGGLRAPAELSRWGKIWWWFHFLILVKLARLRFIAVLLALGLVIMYWDTLMAYYDRWQRPAPEEHAVAADVEYFCPMHPTVVRANNKEKCPICFMPLSRRRKGEGQAEALPPGIVNRVQLSPYRVVQAGIATWEVAYIPLRKEIRTVGYVEFNERELKQVAARVKGRLEKLYVSETGQMVHKGQDLAVLYSSDLAVTVQNLLDAQRLNNQSLRRTAAERLTLWGLAEDQIQAILETGKADTAFKIRSPIEGHVLKKYVKEGQYVEEGTPLYDVADLATVWIQALVFEDELAFLPSAVHLPRGEQANGDSMHVTATTAAYPGEAFEGRLAFVFPHVDLDTRSILVRYELANPRHRLRPGMSMTTALGVAPAKLPLLRQRVGLGLAQGTLLETALSALGSPCGPVVGVGMPSLVHAAGALSVLEGGWSLAIPEAALIDTGMQKIVYRQVLPSMYEGVRVELGPRMTGPDGVTYYPVLAGLAAGDMIVTAGSFLVDAETRLNPAAGSIYYGGSGSKNVAGGNVRPSTPDDEDGKIRRALAKLSSADRRLAEAQAYCPILKNNRLGVMGVPVRLTVHRQPVFVCCKGCVDEALEHPQQTLATVSELRKGSKK